MEGATEQELLQMELELVPALACKSEVLDERALGTGLQGFGSEL